MKIQLNAIDAKLVEEDDLAKYYRCFIIGIEDHVVDVAVSKLEIEYNNMGWTGFDLAREGAKLAFDEMYKDVKSH